MSDLIAQARMCAVCMIGSDECHRTDCEKSCIEVIDELADALEKAEDENERLSVHGGKYMEIAQKRYEMYEAATDRAEKAEAEVERLRETNKALEIDNYNAEMNLLHMEAELAELAAHKEANPPRVHGEWVVDECDTSDAVPSSAWISFHCSVCNMDYGLDEGQYGWCRGEEIPYHFCPNCGADMRKEKP